MPYESRYNPPRSRNLYKPGEQFRVSRSKIDDFLNCPRCFYLDRVKGIGKPPGFPFNINSAVDALLKKEFDHYRELQKPHPLCVENNVDAVPFQHELIEDWRDSLRKGIQFLHKETNLLLTGGVDDVWVNPGGELIIVDYKATSKKDEVSLDSDWQVGYKRQMEIYQWLFRQNGFSVSDTGYFVYCNGDASRDAFEGVMHFDISLLPHAGSDAWIEDAIESLHGCLNGDLPEKSDDCDYCKYLSVLSENGL